MIHHDHSDEAHAGHTHGATKNVATAFVLNLAFSLVELVGGIWTGSIAILSDAFHDFGDSLSLAVSWRLQRISERKPDANYSYGYRRFSLLGALFISMVLLVGSIFIIRASVLRIGQPHEPNAAGMLYLAIFGLLVNGFAAYRLSKGRSFNERAVMLHMMEDVLGWAAVLVVSLVMLFVELPILDPLLSIGISLWVLYNVYRNLRDTLRVLLQHTPEEVDASALAEAIVQLPGVVSIHDQHLWSLDGEQHIITLHVVVDNDMPVEQHACLKEQIRNLCNVYRVGHATIEFERAGDQCPMADGCGTEQK